MQSPATSAGISNITTIIGRGDQSFTQHLSSPIYTHNCNKLQWCKDFQHWARTVRACAEGNYTKAKGMLAALKMLLFRSLPGSPQQSFEKDVEICEIALDPLDTAYANNIHDIIQPIISFVANDSTTNAIRLLSRLNKAASFVTHIPNDSVSEFTKRFISPAQAYLNLTSADCTSAESQNLAMTLQTNANIS